MSTITIKIKGRNIERFIKRLIDLNIELLNIKYIKYNEIIVVINKNDYDELLKVKTIYEVELIDVGGLEKIKQLINKNKYILISLIISIILLVFLCNTIFEVNVIHNDENLRNLLIEELKNNGIEKYKFKKKYNEIQKIKEKILNKYKDKIEWLEIISSGTKYIVRVEERIINKENNNYEIRDIVAKKDSIIIKIEAEDGVILKNKNDYVHMGDTIISGTISLYDEAKNKIMANGKVYGEVWYKATVEYPLNYKETIYTGNKKNRFVLKIFNKEYSIFDFNKYKVKKVKEKELLKNNILPLKLVFQNQREVKILEEKLTSDQAIDRAIQKAKDKIMSRLDTDEYIISTKKLKVEQNNSRIIVEVFFAVCENITDYKKIEE